MPIKYPLPKYKISKYMGLMVKYLCLNCTTVILEINIKKVKIIWNEFKTPICVEDKILTLETNNRKKLNIYQ